MFVLLAAMPMKKSPGRAMVKMMLMVVMMIVVVMI